LEPRLIVPDFPLLAKSGCEEVVERRKTKQGRSKRCHYADHVRRAHTVPELVDHGFVAVQRACNGVARGRQYRQLECGDEALPSHAHVLSMVVDDGSGNARERGTLREYLGFAKYITP
jgi:hypothetical protein